MRNFFILKIAKFYRIIFVEEDEEWNPIYCPMCRELVTVLTWSPSDTILPHEIHDYNMLYRNYSPPRRSMATRPFMAVTFIVYLLIFIQLAPFLSFRFTIQTYARPRI